MWLPKNSSAQTRRSGELSRTYIHRVLGPLKNAFMKWQSFDQTSPHYFSRDRESQNNYLHLVIQKAKGTKGNEVAKERAEKEKQNPLLSTRETSAPMDSTTTRRSPYAWSIMPESAEEGTVALTSMLVQPVSRAEDRVCSNTPRRTTVGPPDSNPTMIQRLNSSHLRMPPTLIHISRTKTLLQIQLHHFQFLLQLRSSLQQMNHHHLSLKLHFNKIRSIQQSLDLFLQNPFDCFLTFLLDTQLHFLVLPKLWILIIFPLLILSSMLLATYLMTTCLRTSWNLHIQDSLGQFGLPHLQPFKVLNPDNVPHHCGQTVS